MKQNKKRILELDVDSIGSQTPLTVEEEKLISEQIKKMRVHRKKKKNSKKEIA